MHMTEGLEVTIKYRGAKYDQVAAPATASSEFAILKKDLAHLRVHSPSQKNVRRINGSFILHWPNAGTSPKVAGIADSLHTRWFKLCSDDPEALKLREFLSIESITMIQDGVQIRATANKEQSSQDAPPGTLAERLGDTFPEVQTAQQPTPISTSTSSLPAKPLTTIPPPRVPPAGPRSDRQPLPLLKRRKSSHDSHDSPPSAIRQKLEVLEVLTASPLQMTGSLLPPIQSSTSPKVDQPVGLPIAVDATKTAPPPSRDDHETTPSARVPTTIAPRPPESQTMSSSPSREPGEMTPQSLIPPSGPSSSGTGPISALATRPSPLSNHHSVQPSARPASPYQTSSSLPANGDFHGPRWRDRDMNELTRALWSTRRELTALQARERVILDDLGRLGARPESTSSDRTSVSRDELHRVEAELRSERSRRIRAERALNEVERECRSPFVVPALFQAFLSISELSN